MNIVRNGIKTWLPMAVVITVLAGLVYLNIQQAYRLGADDPQIQMAEDGASALAAAEAPSQPGRQLCRPGRLISPGAWRLT